MHAAEVGCIVSELPRHADILYHLMRMTTCPLQANRGLLVKGKVSTEGVSAAMAVKAW